MEAALPQFIEPLYRRRFGKERPDVMMSIEERSRLHAAKKAARKGAKRRAAAGDCSSRVKE